MTTDKLYIQPLTTVSGPQAVEGDAVRLAGGMVYAREFAVIVRREGAVVSREVVTADGIEAALARLPAELGAEAEMQWSNLRMAHPPMQLGDRTVRLDQPQVMGILNVTPDSFSDGGKFMDDPEAMRSHAAAMHEAGAAIIDIGGESTRPGAKAVWEGEEIERVRPAVEQCVAMGAVVSVDTRRPAVMEAALDAGAHIINDVSALRYDPRSLELAASVDAPVILMHAPGTGEDLHADGDYDAVLFDVFDMLREVRDRAVAGGVARERIVLDPGIGFGKAVSDNLALLNGLALFHALGQPLLLGASRKRMIGALSNEAPAHERIGGSLALAQVGMDAGVQLLRVHDVFETVQARNVWRGMRDAALTDFGGLVD
ncbi:dihydropteroate synthase [Aurantiacibacter aquimixticola]|uniref:dihydropteroate synthase n=1 Tax=Aurantiacibacter aquimixticola TaxID=1958945 RepID=A0A419RQY2_9SPHN|nr:dihydropteroate synthase [Aurantiacibacter aquimixticola]RJY08222.1 dihydropteroate synthase [Aurantiacibacter aquimixticola]